MQKALVFVSRCQNLESAHNTTKFASKVNDGGFFYTVAAGGSSPAGKTADGGLRSYGSMTYAGLKSMIFAGLTAKDPRVKAASDWIRRNYTLSENPGMGQQGLFYYYDTFAKTLAALKIDEFDDAQGKKHDWRKELADQLFPLQQPHGSWVNPKERWLEGDPNLSTAYALLALKYCEPTLGPVIGASTGAGDFSGDETARLVRPVTKRAVLRLSATAERDRLFASQLEGVSQVVDHRDRAGDQKRAVLSRTN